MTETTRTAPDGISKARLRFAKTGDLRFLSHHDLMRLMERLLRRAGMPLRFTAGFHPKPKIVFANALSLGIVGRQEVVEIEFAGILAADTVFSALSQLAPEGLEFLSAQTLTPQQNAQPVSALYFLPLPPDAHPDLARQLDALLAQPSLPIERVRHVPGRSAHAEPLGEERLDALTRAEPAPVRAERKQIDLRPLVHRLWRDADGLWMELGITNQGAARPEEVLRLLGMENLFFDGASILERVALTLAPDICPPLTKPEQDHRPDLGCGKARPPAAASLLTTPA